MTRSISEALIELCVQFDSTETWNSLRRMIQSVALRDFLGSGPYWPIYNRRVRLLRTQTLRKCERTYFVKVFSETRPEWNRCRSVFWGIKSKIIQSFWFFLWRDGSCRREIIIFIDVSCLWFIVWRSEWWEEREETGKSTIFWFVSNFRFN